MVQNRILVLLLIILFNLSLSSEENILQPYSLGDLEERITFLEQNDDFCDVREIALKTAYIASKFYLYKTSESILIKLLNCNKTDYLIYIELLMLYEELNQLDKIYLLEKKAEQSLTSNKFSEFQIKKSKFLGNSFYKYNYVVSPVFSSNINNGITSETIELFGFPFGVSKNSKPKESFGLDLNADFKYYIPKNNSSYNALNLFVNFTDYKNDIGDQGFIYLGYSNENINRNRIRNVFYSNQIFHDKSVLYSIGFDNKILLQNNYIKNLILTYRKDNYQNSFMTGESFRSQAELDSSLNNLKLSYERFIANSSPYSFQRLSLNFKQWEINNLDLRLFLSKTQYNKPLFIFNKTREDLNYNLRIAFKNKLFLDTYLTVDFSKIDSNISLYENKAVNLFFSKKIKRF